MLNTANLSISVYSYFNILGFKYNLGFSGGYFLSGSYDENLGDEELIKNRHQFWWFPHMHHHMQVKDDIFEKILSNSETHDIEGAQ